MIFPTYSVQDESSDFAYSGNNVWKK